MKIRVRDVMSKTVFSCRPADPLTVPAQLMWEHDVGCVPVLVEDKNIVTGVITDRDLAMAAFLEGGKLADMTVARAMSSDVCWCAPDDDLRDALRSMRERQVHRLPVLDAGNKLVGFLSINDVARKCATEEVPDKLVENVLITIAAIHSPRRTDRVAPGERGQIFQRPKSLAMPISPRAVDDTVNPS